MARRSRPRRGQPRHRFRSQPSDPKKQAAGVVKRLQGARIRSVGTARNYQERLVQIAARLDVALTALTPERAVAYLRDRAAQVGQKTLDMERQAIQAMMVNVTGQLPPRATLSVVKSVEPHRPRPRAYSPAQVHAVAARQDPRNALATEIVHASGIRAHELLTLGRPEEQPPDDRRERSHLTGTAAEGMKFAGRDGVVYTVAGKGGLVREVLLPHRLAVRLEGRRLDIPEPIVDRDRPRYTAIRSRRRSRVQRVVLKGQHRGAGENPGCPRAAPKRGCGNSCTTRNTTSRSPHDGVRLRDTPPIHVGFSVVIQTAALLLANGLLTSEALPSP